MFLIVQRLYKQLGSALCSKGQQCLCCWTLTEKVNSEAESFLLRLYTLLVFFLLMCLGKYFDFLQKIRSHKGTVYNTKLGLLEAFFFSVEYVQDITAAQGWYFLCLGWRIIWMIWPSKWNCHLFLHALWKSKLCEWFLPFWISFCRLKEVKMAGGVFHIDTCSKTHRVNIFLVYLQWKCVVVGDPFRKFFF